MVWRPTLKSDYLKKELRRMNDPSYLNMDLPHIASLLLSTSTPTFLLILDINEVVGNLYMYKYMVLALNST